MTKRIEIDCRACRAGKHRIAATCLGMFAVHPRWSHTKWMRKPSWTVTHLPSGHAVGTAYPGKSAALAAVRAFRSMPIKWDSLPVGGAGLPKKLRTRILRIIYGEATR